MNEGSTKVRKNVSIEKIHEESCVIIIFWRALYVHVYVGENEEFSR